MAKAVHEMMTMGLVAQADPGRTARANRFQHQVYEQWHWERRQRAIMCELLIRGPQTVGELRTHTARMVPLPDLQSVNSVLDELAQADPPWVLVLPRQVGQRADDAGGHFLAGEGVAGAGGAVRQPIDKQHF